jgi:AcrR family transcriptional regulator
VEPPQSARHARTSHAILEAAVRVLAEEPGASVDDVAAAAGVGRATLYRHFPSREALLGALHDMAVQEVGQRLAEAGLERLPLATALERVVRATLVFGDRYSVLTREGPGRSEHPRLEELVRRPIRGVFERGLADGSVRDDVPLETLLVLFRGALTAGVRLVSDREESLEDAVAHVTAFTIGAVSR